jgi:hypothetical protein
VTISASHTSPTSDAVEELPVAKRTRVEVQSNVEVVLMSNCPVCMGRFPKDAIKQHQDECYEQYNEARSRPGSVANGDDEPAPEPEEPEEPEITTGDAEFDAAAASLEKAAVNYKKRGKSKKGKGRKSAVVVEAVESSSPEKDNVGGKTVTKPEQVRKFFTVQFLEQLWWSGILI